MSFEIARLKVQLDQSIIDSAIRQWQCCLNGMHESNRQTFRAQAVKEQTVNNCCLLDHNVK